MEHDHAYKLLFAHPELVADLLLDFVREPWVDALDLATLDRVSASFVSSELRERESDVIWRVRAGEDWLYVYLLIEFQSSVDRLMAVRLLTYLGLLYQDLERRKELAPGRRLPPAAPIVIYNGARRWNAPRELARLIARAPAGMEAYTPRLRYLLLEETRYSEAELAPLRSLLAAVFRLESSARSDALLRAIALAAQALRDPRYAPVRQAVNTWLRRVFLPGRFPGLELPQGLTLEEDTEMLAQRVKDWTQVWRKEGREEGREEGRAEGLEQGLEQGLAAERRMLLRQIERRFGAETASAAEPVLAHLTRPEPLEGVGEAIIDSHDPEDLLARLRALPLG
jgi:predicted transposase YdaD